MGALQNEAGRLAGYLKAVWTDLFGSVLGVWAAPRGRPDPKNRPKKCRAYQTVWGPPLVGYRAEHRCKSIGARAGGLFQAFLGPIWARKSPKT